MGQSNHPCHRVVSISRCTLTKTRLLHVPPLHTQATPDKYMAAVQALQPDLYVTLCDEVTSDAKPKRVTTAVNRTLKVGQLVCKARMHVVLRLLSGPIAPGCASPVHGGESRLALL